MQVEIVFYLFCAAFLSSMRRIISGMKNGCFYLKDSNPVNPYLARYIKNLHFLETPAWYTQFGAVFLYTLSVYRLTYNGGGIAQFILEVVFSMIFTMCISASANYFYQKGVTGDRPDGKLDEFDGNKTEVALHILGVTIQFWRKQWFYNDGRRVASSLGWAGICASLFIYIFFGSIFKF